MLTPEGVLSGCNTLPIDDTFRKVGVRSVVTIQQIMEYLYRIPFSVLEAPNLKIKRPSWFHQPSAMVMFSLVLLSYFLVTGG